MFGIGIPELLMILMIALVVVGPSKLPDLAKGLAKALNEFRKVTDEVKLSITEHETFKDIQNFNNSLQDVKNSVLSNVDSLKHSSSSAVNSEVSSLVETKKFKAPGGDVTFIKDDLKNEELVNNSTGRIKMSDNIVNEIKHQENTILMSQNFTQTKYLKPNISSCI